MYKNPKVESFTLSEMIVVLVVSSIVVALAFSVLRLTQQHMKAITENYNEVTQLQLLEQSLWVDFHRYQNIHYNAEKQQLRFTHSLDTVSYYFYADKIIKARDTFFVSITDKTCYYNAKAINHGVLDAIKLHSEAVQPHKKLFIFKKNDATHLLNYGISIK